MNILINGCSFAADCGFRLENLHYHWPQIFKQYYQCHIDNIAIGGSTNEEIFYRTVEYIDKRPYDLVVILWTSLNRKWIYHNQNNIDDFTIINNHKLAGFNYKKSEVSNYTNLYYKYFYNEYIELKHWLLQINALDHMLKNLKIPYVFARGFDNHLDSVTAVNYQDGFVGMSDSVKNFLDFDNRPDYYLLEKIQILQSLISKIDQTNWLNFKKTTFVDSEIDLADDRSHPGPQTNLKFAQDLILHCQERKLL